MKTKYTLGDIDGQAADSDDTIGGMWTTHWKHINPGTGILCHITQTFIHQILHSRMIGRRRICTKDDESNTHK